MKNETTLECFDKIDGDNYTSRIPNIIDHLTYNKVDEKTGKSVVKRLSVYAKGLYRVLKTVAGEDGVCLRNRDDLAELCNMSAGSVTNAKKELLQNFNELGGLPLIFIDDRQKRTSKNGTIYHAIVVLDIWNVNNDCIKNNTRISSFEKPNGGCAYGRYHRQDENVF